MKCVSSSSVGTTGIDWAHPLVREWFLSRFGRPTEPQELGWPQILDGKTTLISAPTGSGKTLAAFLVCIDRLVKSAAAGTLANETKVLYVSPLKALGNDIQKNLDGRWQKFSPSPPGMESPSPRFALPCALAIPR